jgi:transposase-like protein
MAKIDKVLCPYCVFTAKYIDLILTEEGLYICPTCNASFSYEELMHLYSFSQYTYDTKDDQYKQNV